MAVRDGREHDGRPVRILESFREPRPTTNPYCALLLGSLPADAAARTFSWPAALAGRYDVLHVHWPEVVVNRRNRLRRLGAALLFVLVLVRCRVTGRAIVRTGHNVVPHESQSAATRAVLTLCDRWTTWWIRLNDETPTPAGAPATTIPHGHLRGLYADVPVPPSRPGRLLYFGLVRRYKGVEELLEAFAQVPDESLTLRVAGRPSDADTAAAVRAAAAGDPRVALALEHISDEALAREIGESELVALTYRQMHNSSAVLLALSLGRPVLVPANPVNDALADEVGARWVVRFEGAVGPQVLTDALAQVRDLSGRPDLGRREWEPIGRAHAQTFRSAAAVARRGRTAPWRRKAADGWVAED